MFEIAAAAWMFPALFVMVFLGFPVAFSLFSVSLIFGYTIFGPALGAQLFGRILDISSNLILAAIPLFVFMGAMLQSSGIAKRLFEATRVWLGRLPGGLSVTSIVMCAIFAATSGIIGAVEIVVGLMAIPAMVSAKYSKDLISGTICAGGALGTIIPPSIVVVIYASIADMSVGDLFAGIMIPGAAMVVFFILYILVRSWMNPAIAPPVPTEEFQIPLGPKLWLTFTALVPCTALIVAVLGSIFAGVASPTEAAAVGALGSVLLSIAYNEFSFRILGKALRQTVLITSMVILIIAGGVLFSSIFIVGGGKDLVNQMIGAFELGPMGMIALFLAIIFLLGFILDWISVVLVTIPIFDPLIRQAGIDPVWFGVMVCVTLQTSYLTPPMAPSIFFLRSIAPKDFSYKDMYWGVTPFVAMQLVTLFVVMALPWTATYLPQILFRL
ncbi:MAG: TRAP transporter large permease subunit [Rhodospirillales bacterium]|jgi:tripartite ATP-independent transporter DctM subunit|nr:TRAP transporter large permease subunit [Rhodospirillales bacterium]